MKLYLITTLVVGMTLTAAAALAEPGRRIQCDVKSQSPSRTSRRRFSVWRIATPFRDK
jgi:hypothetical protein